MIIRYFGVHKNIFLLSVMYFFCCDLQERERQKEEKRLEAIRLKEWNRPREDLELDDLKVCVSYSLGIVD